MASDEAKLGTVADDEDTEVAVYREADGAVAFWAPGIGWNIRFPAAEAARLAGLLDRAAMPGQAPPVADSGPPHPAIPGEGACQADDSGWVCTAQAGHLPPHLAHNVAGRVMHAWPATEASGHGPYCGECCAPTRPPGATVPGQPERNHHMQQPTIGRIVHVIVNPDNNAGQDYAPAIITRAWGEDCVNVRLFLDLNPGMGSNEHMTSVPLYPSREVLEAKQNTPGAVLFGAFWPPRA